MFLPHFDVLCDLLLDRCTATWNLFVLYYKEINFVRIKPTLYHVRRAKVGPSPFWQTRKKAFDTIYDLYKMKQSYWLLCVVKELWLVEANHATVKLDLSVASRGMKTYSEARIELRNLQFRKKMLEKSSQFLSSDQPREPKSSDVALNIAGVEKYARKTCDCSRPGGHSIRVLPERKGALVTVEICVLCGRWFSNQFEIVLETPFSCDAVGRELLWAVLCSLLCRELDWNIRIGKQGYVQCLSDF